MVEARKFAWISINCVSLFPRNWFTPLIDGPRLAYSTNVYISHLRGAALLIHADSLFRLKK